jgi:chromosome partitioning protein
MQADEQPIPGPGSGIRRVIAVGNQKGGVGKTTTTVNVSAAIAEMGYRVLVIDLDPQGNATTGLGVNARSLEHTAYDVLMDKVPLDDAVAATSVRNLFVLPATIDLAGAEIELVPAIARESKLRNAIDKSEGWDYIFIDCPPSLGLLNINALCAATEILVPIQCEYYALEGVGQLLRNVQLIQQSLNADLVVSLVVMTMYDARTKLSDQVVAEVREHFGDKVCKTVVPRNVRLSESPSYGQPIITFDPIGRGAVAYREVAKEVVQHAPNRLG